ncbi:MAG: helix-turn-helix domain-containing protein [Micrococcus sp.]|nr:helix-turn-helix domain-containing protein [Micrococcus sp.]
MNAAESAGRPVRLPRAQRRQQLIDVARAVFVEHGYGQTSMDVIAERAQVSKPVLYQHFPGKHDLFLQLLEEEVEALLHGVTAALEDATDNKARTRSALHAVFAYVADPNHHHRLLFDPSLANDPVVGARTARIEQAVSEHISALLRDSAAVSGYEASLVSRTIVTAILAAARQWAEDRDDAASPDLERAVDLTYAVLWRGLSRLE